MKEQKVKVIENTGIKLIEARLKAMIEAGHEIKNVVPLNKTTFLVISEMEVEPEDI